VKLQRAITSYADGIPSDSDVVEISKRTHPSGDPASVASGGGLGGV